MFTALNAQNCEGQIAENKHVGGTQILKSKVQTLVVRGNYTYSIELGHNEKGILARFYSKGGVEFNQDDEIIFFDQNNIRQEYRFIEMGELNRQGGGAPVHQNVLQLNLAAIDWFASSQIHTIYIKNNISNEIRKFTVNTGRQEEFYLLANCFRNALDIAKVKDVDLTALDRANAVDETGRPISATQQGARKVTDINLLNDEELKSLRIELEKTKTQLREEIKAERAKADEIKANIREEGTFAKDAAAQKKNEYAQEVLEARQNSSAEIERIKKEIAESVAAARSLANTEIERINLEVFDTKQKAEEEIQKTKLQSSQEVANAREKATAEIKAIKEKLELAKLEYSEEIASARETSNK